MDYQECDICNRPLVNEHNLRILRQCILISTSASCVIGGTIGLTILPILGFGSSGITAGSLAARWQLPTIAAGSLFSFLQSLDATGTGSLLFGATVSALGLLLQISATIGWCSGHDGEN